MTTEPRHKGDGGSMSERIACTPATLDDLPVGMWEIVYHGRHGFGFEGDALAGYICSSIYALMDAGAQPVAGGDTPNRWELQTHYGSDKFEVAEAVIRDWQRRGRRTPEPWTGHLRAHVAAQELSVKYDGQPRDEAGKYTFGRRDGDASKDPGLVTRPAFLGPAIQGGRVAIQKGIEAALALYAAMSSRNTSESTAVLAFNARAFQTQPIGDPKPETGRLTREQVDEVCPRHAEVQSITNREASAIRREDYTPQAYGTAVHSRIQRAINGDGAFPKDPNFRSEVSVTKTRDAGYGEFGSKRVDVFENPGTGTICVYDIKTGEKTGLSFARMVELSGAARTLYPDSSRIIVTEVRPNR